MMVMMIHKDGQQCWGKGSNWTCLWQCITAAVAAAKTAMLPKGYLSDLHMQCQITKYKLLALPLNGKTGHCPL